jgi:hypothetical protein
MAHSTTLNVLLICIITVASDISAGPPIEGPSFRLILPDGWANDPRARPPAVKGPKGEIFQLSSTIPPATSSTQDAHPLIQEAERRALAIILRIEQNPSFQTFQALSSEQLGDRYSLHYIVSMTRDEKRLFAQYVVAGASVDT